MQLDYISLYWDKTQEKTEFNENTMPLNILVKKPELQFNGLNDFFPSV